jgi:hypothetical protein
MEANMSIFRSGYMRRVEAFRKVAWQLLLIPLAVAVVIPTTTVVALSEPSRSTCGTFQTATSVGLGANPSSVAVGDFNADGKPDLAVANFGSDNVENVSILLGNGNGTFQAAVNYGVGGESPFSVAVGDFNGDSKADLAVANFGSFNVAILLGNGDGTFQAAVKYGAGSGPISVAVGDFNGDSKADLAAGLRAPFDPNSPSDNVAILLGNGHGTFQAAVNYVVGRRPRSVAVGDFNGDGKPDLAVANGASNSVSILLNTCAATVVNGMVTQAPLITSFDPTPAPGGPAGTFTIRATFTNTSSASIGNPFFQVQELSGGNLLLNADFGAGGVGATLTPNVGPDGALSPGEFMTVNFVIGLQERRRFTFFVDLLGVPSP